MSDMISVSVRFGTTDLKSLQALAKYDKNSAGDQIRSAIREYLAKRQTEVGPALAAIAAEDRAVLESLLGGPEGDNPKEG